MPVLCSDLSVVYGSRRALTDFRLSLQPGEIRGLIGPNGSGKSTALQSIAGLIRPTGGRVEIDGRPVHDLPRRTLARKLAYLPQQPAAPEDMTVEQLVRQGRFAHVGLFRRYSPEDEEAIGWALGGTGLTALADRSLRELSGGERQRAWIAAALAQQAQVLLLDEPTSFLDIGHQVDVLDLVHRLSRERGVAIVMAIHDINQAMAVCDAISLLRQGTLMFDGPPAALAGSGLIETVFQVQGRFIEVADGAAPHFDVSLAQHRSRHHQSRP
ncbi:ferrichrome ABC transporter ATP-binding protein (plasmid) [Azospirillum humicireducens]|uniref:Ferrichrome ABC transporter ATP-binding protein n=1 Tax=Azospirillum humicireducens TaxID=1226968 RepID=A0A2R4VUV5_9PROT|nr:ABC transporter ATP-binding protein [Azospirillum humicireducens]AWB08171.1 ferrichrome ABC transporter ATP-binding protein [Azospirillum humicireducens]